MTRAAGILLALAGFAAMASQTVVLLPDTRLVAAGFVALVFGGLLICDNEPRERAENRRRHGHD